MLTSATTFSQSDVLRMEAVIGLRRWCLERSADPTLAVPVRPQGAASTQLDVDLLRLSESGRGPDGDSVLLVNASERLLRPFGCSLEYVRSSTTAAVTARPEIEITAGSDDVLKRSRCGDEPHGSQRYQRLVWGRPRATV
jgi:hypothetical protein